MTMLAEKSARRPVAKEIFYPDSDGQPMADNTLQYEWIEKIKGNCEALFADNSEVFVAGDLLWYPVEGKPKVCAAPDTMVAFGRPKGYRGSYKQWEEGGLAPQVVFEVLSPGNHLPEMLRKFGFYDRHGVEEYYIYDPDAVEFHVALRQDGELTLMEFSGSFVSPRLAVRFELPEDAEELEIYRPDGRRFETFVEIAVERERAEARAERLAARLREMGIDPDAG